MNPIKKLIACGILAVSPLAKANVFNAIQSLNYVESIISQSTNPVQLWSYRMQLSQQLAQARFELSQTSNPGVCGPVIPPSYGSTPFLGAAVQSMNKLNCNKYESEGKNLMEEALQDAISQCVASGYAVQNCEPVGSPTISVKQTITHKSGNTVTFIEAICEAKANVTGKF